jgi:ubiquinone/menaquinone biosynthesis C-methylase UbiE/uncharacterized protein YbaR (Trm112 family)
MVFSESADGHVIDGLLTCEGCGEWFPIQNELLELVVPSLRDAAALQRFRERHADRLPLAVMSSPAMVAADDVAAQLAQRRHFDWFASDAPTTYDRYQESPFWRAVDRATFARWMHRVGPGALLLDVGCANGRSTWPFAATGAEIVGCDISRALIAQAIEFARSRGVHATTTFLVADAAALPFRDETFDAVLTYGALHHLPDPAKTCRDIQRIAKVGGVHFASENNKSAFRSLFDLLMKLKPLWSEEAGQEPLISERMVRDWLDGQPVSIRAETHVFLPPHVIDGLGHRVGAALLRVTDAVGSRVPFVRHNGGLIVFEVEKHPTHDSKTTTFALVTAVIAASSVAVSQ